MSRHDHAPETLPATPTAAPYARPFPPVAPPSHVMADPPRETASLVVPMVLGIATLLALGAWAYQRGAHVRPRPAAPVAQDFVPPLPPAPARDGARIAARHLLVMYRGSMRASPAITRTREEAHVRALEALHRAQSGEDFARLTQDYSDEPGAAERGGSLGFFGRGMMVEPFERAAFALTPGELSPVIETPFGFHVIQRTDQTPFAPPR